MIIQSQFSGLFSKDTKHEATFQFYFKKQPLDCDNCAAMMKLINDVIFEDDKWDILRIGGIDSFKDKDDERVEIQVKEIS